MKSAWRQLTSIVPASSSGIWGVLSVATIRLSGFATVAIVARVSGPDEVGIVALASIVMGGLAVFNDGGIGGLLMTRSEMSDYQRGVCLTAIQTIAVVLAAIGAALAVPASWFLGDSRVIPVLLVLVATIPFLGIVWYFDPVLINEGRSGGRFVLRLIQAIATVGVGAWLAALGLGALALAISQLAGAIGAFLAVFLLGPIVRPRWDRHYGFSILRDGRGFLAQGGFAFLSQNVDNIVVGKVLGAPALGVYALTYRMAEVPYAGVAEPLSQARIPGYIAGSIERRRQQYFETLRSISSLTFVAPALLLGGCAIALPLLFGAQWVGHSDTVAVMALWCGVRVIQAAQGWFINANGGAGFAAKLTGGILVVKIPVMIVAAMNFGIFGVSVVMLASSCAQLIASWVWVRPFSIGLRFTVSAVTPGLLAAVIAGTLALVMQSAELASWTANVPAITAAVTGYLVVLIAADKNLRGRFRFGRSSPS